MGKPASKQKGITFGYCDETTGARVYPPPTTMTDLLPEQLPPSQAAPQTSDMIARITCFPPLGQASVIAREQGSVIFTVLLESNTPSLVADDEISVCLWHNHGNHVDWSELPMRESRETADVVS